MNNILGAFYLHIDGDLIWKNAVCFISDDQYFDSPFVKKVWFVEKNAEKYFYIDMLKEAKKLGAKTKSIIEVCRDLSFDKITFMNIIGKEL